MNLRVANDLKLHLSQEKKITPVIDLLFQPSYLKMYFNLGGREKFCPLLLKDYDTHPFSHWVGWRHILPCEFPGGRRWRPRSGGTLGPARPDPGGRCCAQGQGTVAHWTGKSVPRCCLHNLSGAESTLHERHEWNPEDLKSRVTSFQRLSTKHLTARPLRLWIGTEY